MKQIFQGLIAMQLQTTWQEIFEFRETHTGNIFFNSFNNNKNKKSGYKKSFKHFIWMHFTGDLMKIIVFFKIYLGTVSQAIKAMAYTIEKRRHRKEKQYGMDCSLCIISFSI